MKIIKNTGLKRLFNVSTLLVACGFISSAALAQNYPAKPVTLVVPFAAGGPTDAVARMIAVPMGQSLGQSVIVENTVGAGGTIGANRVAKAAPDGYTIFLHHMGMATAPALYPKLPYNPLTDFEYIGQVADVPMTIVARKDFPAKDFKELLAYIKTHKDKVTMGDAGSGAVSQLCGLLFKSKVGVNITTASYKGTGPAMTDLLGGQIDLLCDQTTNTVANIKAGSIKAYAATTSKRLSALPNLPTANEAGLKGFEVVVWHGMYAPKGTPKPVLDKINAALKVALSDPNVKSRLNEQSVDIVSPDKVTPAGLQKHLDAEIKKWDPILKAAKVSIE